MRITFVLHSPIMSGGMRVIAIYAAALRKRGHHVCMVTPPLKMRQRWQYFRHARRWLGRTEFGHELFKDTDLEWRILPRWRPITDEDVPDADVVIATFWPTVAWVDALSPAKGVKVFFAQHYEVAPGQTNERIDDAWRRPLHKIVICNWMNQIAREKFGDDRASLVPNSVEPKLFDAPPRGKQPVPTMGLLYYDDVPLKGCDESLEAFAKARKQYPDLKLVAFGKTVRSKLPLPSDAEYVCQPDQHAIKDLYASCDAWLWGSYVEGFGLPVLEAMACRTPMISTPSGVAPEALAHGGGILVESGDTDAMADAICKVCAMSDDEWRAISDAAYETVQRGAWVEGFSNGYTWEDAADLFERALQDAAAAVPAQEALESKSS